MALVAALVYCFTAILRRLGSGHESICAVDSVYTENSRSSQGDAILGVNEVKTMIMRWVADIKEVSQ